MFHQFDRDIKGVELPQKFTYPFNYTPHQLTVYAAEQVRRYLSANVQYSIEASEGKMFGVLVVKDNKNRVGFLAAFSGNLMGTSTLPYFVPPVFNFLVPDGYFKRKESEISNINIAISTIIDTPEYQQSITTLKEVKSQAAKQIALAKQHYNQAKLARSVARATANSSTLQQLNRESQFMKGEIKRLETRLKQKVETAATTYNNLQTKVEQLKSTRKELSAELQGWLFDNFQLKNAQGNSCGLRTIFEPTPQKYPPAGAGECAAPRLLQYAYNNNLSPIAMGEFWIGKSPNSTIRHDGYFYPSCRGKCLPILGWMLKGLDVEENPHLAEEYNKNVVINTLFEDNHLLVINKPSGVLSVPGKETSNSVYTWAKQHLNHLDDVYVVHRLDMDTSGILIIAKTLQAYKTLQKAFANREVKKQYIALLDGVLDSNSGTISLPLCADIMDRPLQMVCTISGKEAITEYKKLAVEQITIDGEKRTVTRVQLHPITGRTHQLRVHAAHHQGLNIPICGDRLYGNKAARLALHSNTITFTHPVNQNEITVTAPTPF